MGQKVKSNTYSPPFHPPPLPWTLGEGWVILENLQTGGVGKIKILGTGG